MSNPSDNVSAKLAELRTPVERLDQATDLMELVMDEIASLEDTELTHYIRQGANKLQRKRQEILDNAKARLDQDRREAAHQ